MKTKVVMLFLLGILLNSNASEIYDRNQVYFNELSRILTVYMNEIVLEYLDYYEKNYVNKKRFKWNRLKDEFIKAKKEEIADFVKNSLSYSDGVTMFSFEMAYYYYFMDGDIYEGTGIFKAKLKREIHELLIDNKIVMKQDLSKVNFSGTKRVKFVLDAVKKSAKRLGEPLKFLK